MTSLRRKRHTQCKLNLRKIEIILRRNQAVLPFTGWPATQMWDTFGEDTENGCCFLLFSPDCFAILETNIQKSLWTALENHVVQRGKCKSEIKPKLGVREAMEGVNESWLQCPRKKQESTFSEFYRPPL